MSLLALYIMDLANVSLSQGVRAALDVLIESGFRNCKAELQTLDHGKFVKVTNSTSSRVLGKQEILDIRAITFL